MVHKQAQGGRPGPEVVEDFVPPLVEGGTIGDGNGDGIPDREQTDVASVPIRETDQVSVNPNAQWLR